MVIYPLRRDSPNEVGEVGKFNKHIIHGKEGHFNTLVWECTNCGGVRVKGKFFENRCPEYDR